MVMYIWYIVKSDFSSVSPLLGIFCVLSGMLCSKDILINAQFHVI